MGQQVVGVITQQAVEIHVSRVLRFAAREGSLDPLSLPLTGMLTP